MGRVAKDLTGQKFGKLTVIKRVENRIYSNGYETPQWLCKCDCGNDTIVIGKNLTKKNGTKSCGCFIAENMSKIKKRYNTYDLTGEYGIGYTSNNKEFYFDLEDYDKIKDYCWYIHKSGYVVSSNNDSRQTIKMHRLILDCNDDLTPDHIHGKDTRNDNRKSNLRIVTHSQNMMNRKLSNNKSGVTGVFWDKNINKWLAYINVDKVRHYLGSFDSFENAKSVRKKAEEKYHGEYSYDNSMGDLYEQSTI